MSSSAGSRTNSDLIVLFYGALVGQLCKDLNNEVTLINDRLFKMGKSIGERLIDDFLAKGQAVRIGGQLSVQESLKKACKLYLGVDSEVIPGADANDWDLQLQCNPFQEHFQVPIQLEGLEFSAVLAGIANGALMQVQMRFQVSQIDSRTFRFKRVTE
jgi:hypothetical protein